MISNHTGLSVILVDNCSWICVVSYS